jgi:predicted MFS family arabinose efflux permease
MSDISDQKSRRGALRSLLFGNFVIGTGVLLPAGLLNVLGTDLNVTPSTAGLLLFSGGLVVGVGAPMLAGFTSSIDRRLLLTVSAATYAIGHVLAALAPEFWSLLIIRTITMIAAALFTPQAAATVGLIVPAEKRSQAIAFIFLGWSMASVAGIPLGSILAAQIGWRATFFAMGGLSAIAMIGVWLSLGPGLRVQPLQQRPPILRCCLQYSAWQVFSATILPPRRLVFLAWIAPCLLPYSASSRAWACLACSSAITCWLALPVWCGDWGRSLPIHCSKAGWWQWPPALRQQQWRSIHQRSTSVNPLALQLAVS